MTEDEKIAETTEAAKVSGQQLETEASELNDEQLDAVSGGMQKGGSTHTPPYARPK